MDLNKIKQVVDLMKKSDLSEFEIQDQEFKLRIKRDVPGRVASAASTAPAPAPVAAAPAAPAPAAAATAPAVTVADPSIKLITSPMVGTYYATPSPENPTFVTVGSPVKADSVVCIIEAMKVMNEIQSEIAGTIVECLVANGTSVEFGQPLFRVKVG
ncbi:MAG: acetyl-CoA carboxylase biotin carboxyl carrier protein [Verrucomicrobia bacterium]|nr:acetyl-CoA carboxylase biotin carboxyl carrier protein [Verrucomicrobiota bacterium]NBS04225.1 acetyl-CoA carboxylase biotin carboxyl carrier protein [Verrucomicrobiota bacterium]